MNDEPLNLLGFIVQDKVTGLRGVVTSISFDLYGCVQAIIQPPQAADGSIPEVRWMDVCRLALVPNNTRVMKPNFAHIHGPAEKPLP